MPDCCEQCSRGGCVVGPSTALFAGNEACVDENFHMVRDRRLGELDGSREVAHAHLPGMGGGDEREQLDPGGVSQRFEYSCEICCLVIVEWCLVGSAAISAGGFCGRRLGHDSILPHILTCVDAY